MAILRGLLVLSLMMSLIAEEDIPYFVQCPTEQGSNLPAVYFANPCNCSKYYACGPGDPQDMECRNGLFWDTIFDTCNWPDTSICISPVCPDDQSTSYFSHSRDCGYYFECINGTPVCKQCPIGLHWDMAMLKCDIPCQARCKEDKETDISGFVDCTYLPNVTTFVDPEDCGAFYICTQGVLYHRKCITGLYFNPSINICDFPEHVNCKKNIDEPEL